MIGDSTHYIIKDHKGFKKYLKELKGDRMWKDFAADCGFDKNYISSVLRNERRFTYTYLRRISKNAADRTSPDKVMDKLLSYLKEDDPRIAIKYEPYEPGFRSLLGAIGVQACIDYQKALETNNKKMLDDCIAYFKSPMFRTAAGYIPINHIKNRLEKLPKGSISRVWRKTRKSYYERKNGSREKLYPPGYSAAKSISQKIQGLL